MRKGIFVGVLTVVLGLEMSSAPARAADGYTVDPVHSSVYFRISHLGLSYVYGRFDTFSGNFTIDAENPGNTSFAMTIKTESVDTNNKGRDGHLRNPDFFNAKQFPEITFKSTSLRPVEGGYEVTGDLTMHGVTKPITFVLKGGKTAEFQGKPRTGFSTEFTIKRADFGIDKFPQMLGEEVLVAVGLEGVKR